MEKIYLEQFDETLYKHTLKNGLNLYIFHKPEAKTTMACFATPYGALNILQDYKGETLKFPAGIAHFLEHKLFEKEDDNILEKFTQLGCKCNAFTSYDQTLYYFSTASLDIEKPLNTLLDFVQNLDINEASVEKEKPIIVQELKMYEQYPDMQMYMNALKCLYHNYPLKYDIGGDEESVNSTTLEQLKKCYEINYHPSNMTLVITSCKDPNYLLSIVEKNQDSKSYTLQQNPKDAIYDEPIEVFEKVKDLHMDIQNQKALYAVKLNFKPKDEYEAYKIEQSIKMYLTAYFSDLNLNYEDLIKQNKITENFTFETSVNLQSGYVIFVDENICDGAILKNVVEDVLKQNIFNLEILLQLKRRVQGSMFKKFNNIESFTSSYTSSIIKNKDQFKLIEIINSLTKDEITSIFNQIDFNNCSFVNLKKIENN